MSEPRSFEKTRINNGDVAYYESSAGHIFCSVVMSHYLAIIKSVCVCLFGSCSFFDWTESSPVAE